MKWVIGVQRSISELYILQYTFLVLNWYPNLLLNISNLIYLSDSSHETKKLKELRLSDFFV